MTLAATATLGEDVAWAARVSATPNGLTFSAAAGESNDVSFARTGGGTVVTDAGAALDAGSACSATGDPHAVRCSRPPVDVAVRTEDGADRVNGSAVRRLTVDGGAGDDAIVGGPAGDFLCGGGGNDVVAGGTGDDSVCGDLDDDQTRPPTAVGDDIVAGGPGHDFVNGGPGADHVSGGGGADNVDGGLGADRIDGGPGDDLIDLSERLTVDGSDRVAGDSGYDAAFYHVGSPVRSAPIGASLDGQPNDGQASDHDNLDTVEYVVVVRTPGIFSWTASLTGDFMVRGAARLIVPSRAARPGVDTVLSGDPYAVSRRAAPGAAAQVRLLGKGPAAAASSVHPARTRCRRARRLSTSASPTAPAASQAERQGGLRVVARASASVSLGTAGWVTRDSCAGTRTTVRSGSVAVSDFHRHRTVMLRAGQSYLARRGNR